MPQSIAVFRFLMVQIEIIFIQIYIPFPKVQILFVNDIPIIIYENSHFVIFLPLPYIGQSVFYNMIISVFIGYVADYSKFRILRPFQRVYRTKPGIFYLVPPGQQYPYAVRRISLYPCTFDKFPAAVLDFIKGGVVQ